MIQFAHGFTKMTIIDFESWIKTIDVQREVLTIQLHHTWRPNYSYFKRQNHFDLQIAMRNYHVNNNGWDDVGQHFTIFPDGIILTGRSLNSNPAGIFGFNKNSVCIENVGNFDKGCDEMTPLHQDAVVKLTAILCKKFSVPIHSDKIVYHHWFDIATGNRNDGLGVNNKSCPGTNFFGGNAVYDCEQNFLPLVVSALNDDLDIR